MAIPLTINGVTFQYPTQFDVNWGPTLTNWSSAVTSGMLQKAGGSFPLTAEVDFGASFGLKVLSIKSEESNIASAGFLRLANASSGLVWRNAGNSANLALTVNASNQLTFNGSPIGATTSLTNGHILVGNASNQPADVAMSGDITIDNTGVTAIGAGIIVNADINASAAISVSKLAALSVSRLAVTDSSGFLTTLAAPSLTEIGYVSGVTSAIQTQLNAITTAQGNYLPLAGGTMSGAINMASHKITALTAASATGDAVSYQQTGGAVVGSTANTGGTQGTLSQGTVSTPDLRANAVTQIGYVGSGTSSDLTALDTRTITTIGGPVLIMASAALSGNPSSSVLGAFNVNTELRVTRGGTSITGGASSAWVSFPAASSHAQVLNPVVITVDTPAAGTYTYNLTYAISAGTVNGVSSYGFTVVELRR